MRRAVVLVIFVVVSIFAQEVEETVELPLAAPCDEELCRSSECRCSSTTIPGSLLARDTPQFVTVTFDDGINVVNIETYRKILYGRRNSNGCPSGFTFFVNHEYTNYQLVNELYNQGFEIASHSITHQTPQTYWQEAIYEDLVKEFADHRTQIAHFANIPIGEIKGIRSPFLQLSGNNSYLVIKNHGLVYDSSWTTASFTDPPLWPYTLDYASVQDCQSGPCPTAAIPGVWVQPMVSWRDLLGLPCSMADACFNFPDRINETAWYQFILTNFERHYMTNRAPFGVYIHEGYISAYPAVQRAFVRFFDLINNLDDAFLVNSNEVIDWMKDPLHLIEYKKKLCRTFQPTTCQVTSCTLTSQHNDLTYWMQLCNTCPRVYPWLGNPLGE
ncbi:hypothetical protein O0L34_g1738 [Tuta absoluta]|nr:hypothetical protein O0L34_g1738 [Tuta absoluta]